MKTPHKHAELIKAWADGAEIEYKGLVASGWMRLGNPDWSGLGDYRIKPEPKPDVVEKYFARSEFGCPRLAEHWERVNLKLTFCGETGELKSAEVI